MWHENDDLKILEAMGKFPQEFALTHDRTGRYRISQGASYVDSQGQVMLYTQRLQDGKWLDYAKGTPNELLIAMVRIA